ncbi:exostosin family-domain-containing protein [Tribonema minus]|uniref:Exostosin family-domain-containing protein n=1 Tax=Tribonema minus TaxID=303371 RepID=A0A835ZIG6_9STRA|nr:exostosin family-domain-containing protein [Tribonema minus]
MIAKSCDGRSCSNGATVFTHRRRLYDLSPEQLPLNTTGLDLTEPVPFYLYKGPAFDWESNCSRTVEDPQIWEGKRNSKHGGELAFVQQLERHPWRVHNPERAKLFVVPTLWGLAARMKGCLGHTPSEMAVITAQALEQSPWFRARDGRDHLTLSTDFKSSFISHTSGANATLSHTIWAGLCGPTLPEQCFLTVPFAGVLPPPGATSDELLAQSYEEWRQRPIRLYFRGQVDRRRAYHARRVLGGEVQALPSLARVIYASSSLMRSTYHRSCPDDWHECLDERPANDSCVACTSRAQPDTFAQEVSLSQFCFSIEGDNERTSRLHEAVRMGCIPIIIGDHIWAIGQPADYKVPWWDMTYHIPLANLTVPMIQAILDAPREEIQRKRVLLRTYAPDVLWDVPDSRVASNTLFEAYHRCVRPLAWLNTSAVAPLRTPAAADTQYATTPPHATLTHGTFAPLHAALACASGLLALFVVRACCARRRRRLHHLRQSRGGGSKAFGV